VRFVLRTPIDHEFILGDDAVQRRHEQVRERQHHGEGPGERSVAGPRRRPPPTPTYAATPSGPGWTGGPWRFVCHLPGHHAYGMRGTVKVG
jgi:hypothetical protein